jgi:predicted dehydrogenase
MATNGVKLAVIGTGFMGEAHIHACLANRSVELVAICDVNEERLDALGTRYGIERRYQDSATLLRQESLDGVIVATPDPEHVSPVAEAAAAGVHVLLEKPIATKLDDAETILTLVEESGIVLLLGFTLRHDPAMKDLHARIQVGAIGQPTSFYAKRQCRLEEGRRLGHRVTALTYLGVHDIDLALWSLGTEVAEVYGTCHTAALADVGTPDFYWTLIRWRDGATAVIHSSWAMSDAHSMAVEATLEVLGTDGAIAIETPGNRFYFCGRRSAAFAAPDRAVKLQEQITHFGDCIRRQARPVAGGRDGWNALRVIKAAEESIATGQPVPVRLSGG